MITIPIWVFILSLFLIASISCITGYILCSLFVVGKQADIQTRKVGLNEKKEKKASFRKR